LNRVYLTAVHLIHSCGKVHKSLSNGKVGVVQNRLEWNYCAAEGIIAHLVKAQNYLNLAAHCMKNVKPGSLGFRVGLWCGVKQ